MHVLAHTVLVRAVAPRLLLRCTARSSAAEPPTARLPVVCRAHACYAAAPPPSGVKELPVARLAELLAAGEPQLQCVDVREPWEHETASLPGFKLYPLSRLQSWAGSIADELDPSAPTVVLCHHGVRSRSVSEFLVERLGFTDVSNISGGIDAYSRRVDASVPLY